MEQSKQYMLVEEAAKQFAPPHEPVKGNGNVRTLIQEAKQEGFKAGAEWQKEQDKELIEALESVIDYLNWRGVDNRVPEYAQAKEILKKYKP